MWVGAVTGVFPWPQNLRAPLSPCFVGSLQWEGEAEALGTPSSARSAVAGLGHLGLILCGEQQGTAASRGEACTCASSLFASLFLLFLLLEQGPQLAQPVEPLLLFSVL